ncbi:MAG TPA: alpha-ketoglutarate-dependent dioxygenase AlkB [Cryptosporangiaceae bacterium]|nr:alpha-ketoglutarate-dependent dioxygenase AlkB [Cryptosporangiaceae bacterium]
MRGVVERPAGLAYRPDLLDGQEQQTLLAALDGLDLRAVQMRGQTARRTVRHFGFEYGYESWGLRPTDPLPPSFAAVRERCAQWAGVEPVAFAQTLVTRYPPGAGIGWHRDAPIFGAVVAGVSLLSACTLRFQRRSDGERRVYELELAPGSGYLLSGPARTTWQHSIPPVAELRYSITFRTIRAASSSADHGA